jgi:hypothetical protein
VIEMKKIRVWITPPSLSGSPARSPHRSLVEKGMITKEEFSEMVRVADREIKR